MLKLGLDTELRTSADFLAHMVDLQFYNTVVAVQMVREGLIKGGQASKEVQSINELMSLFGQTNEHKVTYNNGYHVNQAITNTSKISVDNHVQRPDYNNFFLATQPVMDDNALNPPEFNLVRGIFGDN